MSMNSRVAALVRNDFIRNVFTLLTWNSLAQVVTLVSIPILTRIYTPEEFGAVALFIGMVNVFSVASNGRYDMAIVLPKRNGQAFHLMVVSIVITIFFSILSLLLVVIFFDRLTGMFESDIYKQIIWFIPVSIFLVGSHKSLTYWFNRSRSFRLIGMNRLIQNTGQTGVRLGRGIFSSGHWGLVVGYITGEFISWGVMVLQLFKREYWRFKYLSMKTAVKSAVEYLNFPLFLMPMGVLNSLSVYLLVFALSFVTSSAFVGHYERAWRVIIFPLSLVSASFGSVFYEKMNRTVNRRRFYLFSYFGNLGLAMLILFPIAFWSEEIFCFVLGSEWAVAGRIARIILPLTIFNFATECISTIFSVIRKNQILLIWQAIYLGVGVGWIFFAKEYDVFFLLKVYSAGGAAMYFLLALVGFINIEKNVQSLTNK
jgi:O-antigen/teichoic acid export membrane protein